MRKIRRTLGLAVLAATSLAVVTVGTGNAIPPKLSVSVTEGLVDLVGACPNEAPKAHGWYGFVDGVEPEEIKEMTYANGSWTTHFTNVKPGTYIAVMGCDGEQDTVTQRFVVEPR
ncbi:hypothetical protein NLX83_15420 [Allokutzneria sp. A3M-2-11 16]|uniref:hypothetical protein n=1 Tax=Allokutzneria sp. A3M-2-11 16 TaxID=2962043 RepID=UPI0020B8C0DE|nr:hypothetical protein [Allokutzneria sp. A3M-2-11 16]MCP3800656.1 hypothetical protein [Allokutzneria sp. A3M-2-11 16]